MKIPSFLKYDIKDDVKKEYLSKDEFVEEISLQNIHRGKQLAIVVIALEVIFLLILIVSYVLKVNDTFSFFKYSLMYVAMIIANLLLLNLIDRFSKGKTGIHVMNKFIIAYMTFIMSWGSIISLMDQALYGQIMTFMVNMMVCSIIYLTDEKMMAIPYLTSTLILAIGLPLFQKSSNVLIGHYVNLFVFVVISWVASRILYRNHCDNYIIKKLMNNSEIMLERKIAENKIINKKLAIANAQLKKLALYDELTGLSNRRNFREFVDEKFMHVTGTGLTVSVIMIDVDYFKHYNDSCGHEKGDLALIEISKQIDSMVKSVDQIAVRWGGEEFVFAALNETQDSINKIADTLRLKICELKIPNGDSSINPYITISLGTCTGILSSTKNISQVIKIADQALYIAKNNGRNCVATLPYIAADVI
ncbi:MAG: GGDEF domain-containing protein [Clostridiaceae bacterium]|nr:GGDEF domain-containing protein [Clostridiaceae bacterium]